MIDILQVCRLATELYRKKSHYVYELIQNAEDNAYTKAIARREPPFLRFIVSQDSTIVESNEDGFTYEHVTAICRTGESSKIHRPGYIGEKGIGFKSVFNTAKRVHIQSGPFSFSFSHTRATDEDGLGMVTPYEQGHSRLPSEVMTRFTLTPRDDASFDERVSDVEGLPQTFLLFLSKLKIINVTIRPPSGVEKTTTFTVFKHLASPVEEIAEVTTEAGVSRTSTLSFRVFKNTITDLPEDPARRNIRSAEVILAFPVDTNEQPMEAQQFTYAYLPLRKAGFNVSQKSALTTKY